LGINEKLTTCTAGKLRLGYPESITPEGKPFLINVATSSVNDFYLHLSILLVEM